MVAKVTKFSGKSGMIALLEIEKETNKGKNVFFIDPEGSLETVTAEFLFTEEKVCQKHKESELKNKTDKILTTFDWITQIDLKDDYHLVFVDGKTDEIK